MRVLLPVGDDSNTQNLHQKGALSYNALHSLFVCYSFQTRVLNFGEGQASQSEDTSIRASFWCLRDAPSSVDRQWAACKHSFRKHTRWRDFSYDELPLQTAASEPAAVVRHRRQREGESCLEGTWG